MIVDQLADCDLYRKLSEGFAAGFDYLRSTAFEAVADGRYPIVDDDVFAMVQSYETKPPEQGRWEAHRHHADIQFVASGSEQIGVGHISGMTVQEPFSRDKDVEFFLDPGDKNRHFVRLNRGDFAIFLPQDVHMPCIAIDSPMAVRKVVVKVKLM